MATSSITKDVEVKDVERFISLIEELERNSANSKYDKAKSELYNSNNREQVTKLLKQLKSEYSTD